MEICTANEDIQTTNAKPHVVIKADERLYNVASIDSRIKLLRVARRWLDSKVK